MKKLVFPAIAATLLFTACQNEVAPGMTENEMEAKVDSIVGTRLDELNQQATEDLDRRVAIEVKPKADSIVAARDAAHN
ncbi:MAG TPA: hypothetical protein VIN07_06920 [Flavipsychrobacter sp.]